MNNFDNIKNIHHYIPTSTIPRLHEDYENNNIFKKHLTNVLLNVTLLVEECILYASELLMWLIRSKMIMII